MTTPAPRIAPLAPEQFTDEQKTLVGDWTYLNFSRVVVQHPEMYRLFLPMLDRLIRRTLLPPRDREILIIRTLAASGERYESLHHDLIAANAGMPASEIAAIRGDGAGLAAFDRLLMQLADELVAQQRISDATWEALGERYSMEQMMESVFLVGTYTTMAMLTNGFGIPVESESTTFDKLTELRQYT